MKKPWRRLPGLHGIDQDEFVEAHDQIEQSQAHLATVLAVEVRAVRQKPAALADNLQATSIVSEEVVAEAEKQPALAACQCVLGCDRLGHDWTRRRASCFWLS